MNNRMSAGLRREGRRVPGAGLRPGGWGRWSALGAAVGVAAAALVVGLLLAGGAAWAGEVRRLDDFTRTYEPDEAPEPWATRLSVDFFQFVHNSEEEHYIHLKTGEDGSGLVGIEDEFQLQDWPILEWEWRVTQLPKGGDVRDGDKDDQAGNVCIGYDPTFYGTVDVSLCYLFENEGPVGTEGTSVANTDTKYVILRAADTDKVGEWYKESRNIYEDFKRLHGFEPEEAVVLGFYIDSDDTETSAEAYYRNVYQKKP